MTGIPCRVEPRLIEQNFGKWESTPRDGEDFKKAKEFFACSHEGGESTLRLAQRIYNLLDDIKKESEGKTYIPVSYTHLDVYKRQRLQRLRWWLWKSSAVI